MDTKFIVSARKYRPQTFDTVVGQEHITTTLKNAIRQDQLAHAFLFCGPRGVGKTTCARILAKTINCENLTAEGEACNACISCVSFNNAASLNIHELDAASNNSVDDIRALVEQVRFAPQAGNYKVYIVDEVHMLSSAAFNAFLKTLEEPPPYAIFILATTEKHKILPTILSRCQIFDFRRITTNDTVVHLAKICEKENVKAEKEALQTIAQKSEGCMRDALSIMDKIVSFTNGELTYANTLEHLNILDEDYYFRLMGLMLEQDLSGAMLLYNEINSKGFEGDLVLNGFAEFIRNLLVSKDAKVAALLDTVESFKERYKTTATDIPAALLVGALNILSEAEMGYRSARNKRLHVELAIIKLCYLKQAMQIVSDGNAVVEKKITETTAIPFRKIQPIAASPKKEKNKKEQGNEASGAKLTIIEKEPVKQESNNPVELPSKPIKTKPVKEKATSRKISTVEKIIQQYKSLEPEKTDEPLEENNLKKAWDAFVKKLKKEKNSAAQSFEMARLKILDENSFYVYTSSIIEHRFVDSCKNDASEFLQEKLQNTQLQFYIIRQENAAAKEAEEQNAPLTSMQQYQMMIEKFPLIKELKSRLKLELDR
ncbi:MAG: DNA polymerase III subunit gamma/tau [Niabella sp.]